jgi:hypothetical protein
MDTGWSLSSGRPKAGPVGRYDKVVRAKVISSCPPCLCGSVSAFARLNPPRYARLSGADLWAKISSFSRGKGRET